LGNWCRLKVAQRPRRFRPPVVVSPLPGTESLGHVAVRRGVLPVAQPVNNASARAPHRFCNDCHLAIAHGPEARL